MNISISDAKLRVLIPDLMRLIGVPPACLPKYGSSNSRATSVRCPWFHLHRNQDKNPSCSIHTNGTRIHCFVCGYDLDGPEFLKRWKNVSIAQAIRSFNSLAVGRPPVVIPAKRAAAKMVSIDLRSLSEADKAQIARLRAIDVTAVEWACNLGVLHFSQVCGYRSWVLTDGSLRIAEARRLDGKKYPEWGNVGERKAHTIKGSEKSWPLGIELLRRHAELRAVVLVEGGPDFLAALHWIHQFRRCDILPVAMLGKAEIHPDAVQLMRGQRVRIYPHNDPDGGGLKTALRWSTQLRQSGCQVDLFHFDGLNRTNGQPVKDLNDLTTINPHHLQIPQDHQKLHFLLP